MLYDHFEVEANLNKTLSNFRKKITESGSKQSNTSLDPIKLKIYKGK